MGNAHPRGARGCSSPGFPALGVAPGVPRHRALTVLSELMGKKRESCQSSSYLRQSCTVRNCVIQLPCLAKS